MLYVVCSTRSMLHVAGFLIFICRYLFKSATLWLNCVFKKDIKPINIKRTNFKTSESICGPWIPDDGKIFTHTISTSGKMTQTNWTAKVSYFYLFSPISDTVSPWALKGPQQQQFPTQLNLYKNSPKSWNMRTNWKNLEGKARQFGQYTYSLYLP